MLQFFFSPLMGFSKLLPKANNMGQILQTSLHIYSIFSIGGSFYLLSPLPLRSLNQQAPLLSLLLRVCISLSVSLYIHFSPDPQHHLVKTQNMIALSVNKVTRVHQIPKGILWPASSLQETQQSLPTKWPKHPVTEERLLKCNTLKSSKRFLFCINVKITCILIEYLKSYKNILKTNPDSLPATAIKSSMKYIKTQRLFVKKKKGRKEGRVDEGIHRSERSLMHCIGQSCQTPAAELERRAGASMVIQYIYAHVSQPETWLRGRQQAIRGHLNHWMQLSDSLSLCRISASSLGSHG